MTEFTDSELKAIEKLGNSNLINNYAKSEIMSFLRKYRLRTGLKEITENYVDIVVERKEETTSESGCYKKRYILYVRDIDENGDNGTATLKTDQCIIYDFNELEDITPTHAQIITVSREKFKENYAYGIKIGNDTTSYKYKIIDREEYEEELIKAININ